MKKVVALLLILATLLTLALPSLPISAASGDIGLGASDDGLQLNASAYQNANLQNGVWQGEGGQVLLDGEYTPSPDGKGFVYTRFSDDPASATGIRLANSLMGTGNFTVEMVIAPLGLTDRLTGEAYINSDGRLTTVKNAFQMGGLRGDMVISRTALYNTEQMGTTWYYGSNTEPSARDNGLDAVTFGDIVTYTISCERQQDGSEVYRILANGALMDVITISAAQAMTWSNNDFSRFFYGVPAKLYAVRVYNRLLTESDTMQNHLADICAYHDVDEDVLALLDTERLQALAQEAAYLAVDVSANKFCRLVSSYLTKQDLGEGASDAFFDVASYYGLDLTTFLKANNKAEISQVVGALEKSDSLTTEAVQALLDSYLGGPSLTDLVLQFVCFDSPQEGAIGVRANFALSAPIIRLLEQQYSVRAGAIVGLSAEYPDASSLTVDNKGNPAVANAFTYLAYKQGKAAEDFSYTVRWDDDAYCNRSGYKHGLVFRGFLILTDKDGKSQTLYTEATEGKLSAPSMYSLANYLVCQYEGDSAKRILYNSDAKLRRVLSTSGLLSIPTYATEDEVLLASLQKSLAEGLEAAKLVSLVRYCGYYYDSYQQDAIWIEYLDGYYNGNTAIRPAYLYFPTRFDPSKYSDAEKEKAGITRVFCYIGIPQGTGDIPGLVCVHGGGGHAYGNYVAEAVRHGFAAIAIDTDGYKRNDPNKADGGSDAYHLDSLGMPKDGLMTTKEPIEKQWMYYVQRALIYANTALRAQQRVQEDEVGITGISWGGFATTIAISYDDRYAFAVPVYISGNMDESLGLSLADLKTNAFAAALWQNDELLTKVEMPVLILNSDRDYFSSLNANDQTYRLIPGARMCIIPALTHTQQHGATVSEVYSFGLCAVGRSSYEPLSFDKEITAALGRHYTLSVAGDLTERTATLVYLTEPIKYDGQNIVPTWQTKTLTIGTDGRLTVDVPEEAYLYYLVVEGYTTYAKKPGCSYGNVPAYDGRISTTSSLIAIGVPQALEK